MIEAIISQEVKLDFLKEENLMAHKPYYTSSMLQCLSKKLGFLAIYEVK